MQKTSLPFLRWNIIVFAIAILVIAVDQISKFWIQTHFSPGQSLPASGFFRLTYAQNTGAAFSIFYGHVEILTIVSFIGVSILLLYILYFSRHYPTLDTPVSRIAVALILGGATGNLIDRLWLGYVRDFIDIGPWPIFNVADSSTVVGVIIFACFVLFCFRSLDSKKTENINN